MSKIHDVNHIWDVTPKLSRGRWGREQRFLAVSRHGDNNLETINLSPFRWMYDLLSTTSSRKKGDVSIITQTHLVSMSKVDVSVANVSTQVISDAHDDAS